MENLPDNTLHIICKHIGYKDSLNLCKTNSILNQKITEDVRLWKYYTLQFTNIEEILSAKYIRNRLYTKESFLNLICDHLWINIDLNELYDHKCRKDNE